MNKDSEQYINGLEKRIRSDKTAWAMTGGVILGGGIPVLGYEGLMHLIGRETQGIESMATLLVGMVVGSTVTFIRETRRQQHEDASL